MSVNKAASALRLQFLRARESGDPYAFRFEPQDYILPTDGGDSPSARFDWAPAVLADLEAIRRPGRDSAVVQRVGDALRRFVRDAGWADLEAEIAQARAASRLVILTIRSSAAELYVLPWELLTLKSGQFIGELDGLLLRFEWPGGKTVDEHPLPRPEGGRILVAWSAAAGAVPAAEQISAIETACKRGFHPFDSRTDVIAHASLERIVEALTAAATVGPPISVLHILCHGGVSGHTYGLVVDGSEEPVVVDAAEMRQQLAPFAKMVRLVILSACDSGNYGSVGNHLGSIAQALHRCGFQSVIASRYPLSVRGSISLTASLYGKLLVESSSLEAAFLDARKGLMRDALNRPKLQRDLDWASLQLYARHDDGDDTRPFIFRPFRGLLAFQREHSRFFFGREAEQQEILGDLQRLIDRNAPRFLVVAGASGTGKSSVVLAGAVPKLLAEQKELIFRAIRPGSDPMTALEQALGELAAKPGLLVVDQFEEVFTQTADAKIREAFVQKLWRLASGAQPDLRIIITLRVDFLGRCGELQLDDNGLRLDRVAYDEAHRVFVAQLHPDRLREAIEGPADKAGLLLAPGLVDRLLTEVGREPGALPLLEDALDVLWQHRDGRYLTQAAYRDLGGVIGALQRRADAIVDRLTTDDFRIARRLLVYTVAVADDTALDTRRRIALAELRRSFAGQDATSFDRVLKEFVNARLLVQDDDKKRPHVEVAHEALIRSWPRLRGWLDEDRAGLVIQRRVNQAATQWDQQGQDESLLYRGTQLAQASEWRSSWESRMGDLEQRFLSASEALRMRQEQDAAERLQREREAADKIHQLLLDTYIDRGHQLLFAEGKLDEGLLWLHRAYKKGSKHAALPYLLRSAMRRVDATKAVLRGHLDSVWSATFSPDGRCIVTASKDGMARLWDANSGRLLAVLKGHGDSVLGATFSPDGRRIVTASWDGTARVWAADSACLLGELKGHRDKVWSAVFSPDGRCIVTASWDETARVWEAANGRLLTELKGHEDSVNTATFSPDGNYIVTASDDKTARVWEAGSGRLVVELKGHGHNVVSATFSPHGSHIASASWDHTARVFDAASGVLVAELQGHEDSVSSVTFSPDGSRIVTASWDRTARVWEARSGRLLVVLKGHRDSVLGATFSPDSRRIITAGSDKAARVWDANNGRLLAELKDHEGSVSSAIFSPDGRRIATASADKTARLLEADSGLLVELTGHKASITRAMFSPDGRYIATASADHTARVWEVDGGRVLAELKGHGESVWSVAFSPDSRRLVTASTNKTTWVFDADSGCLVAELKGHLDRVRSAMFSPDGYRIVTASKDKTARVFDSSSGRVLAELKGHAAGLASATFSPDGRRIVTASEDKTARIWDVDEGRLLAELKGHRDRVWSAMYSPDGYRIITASKDNVARLFDSASGRLLAELKGHGASLTSALFSPNSCNIVTASVDGTARVWGTSSGRLLAELKGHEATIWSAMFSPDGRRIVTASADSTARIWDTDSGRMLAELKGHGDSVVSALFGPKGHSIVTASWDHTARIWDAAPETRTPEQLAELIRCHVPVQFEQEDSNVIISAAPLLADYPTPADVRGL